MPSLRLRSFLRKWSASTKTNETPLEGAAFGYRSQPCQVNRNGVCTTVLKTFARNVEATTSATKMGQTTICFRLLATIAAIVGRNLTNSLNGGE